MGREHTHYRNTTRGAWYTPKQKADDLRGFPTNTLEGGLKSVKAKTRAEDDGAVE